MKMVNDLVEKKLQQAQLAQGNIAGNYGNVQMVVNTGKDNLNSPNGTRVPADTVKSPSDTTIYAPGLKLTPKKAQDNLGKSGQRDIIDQISNFVEQVRLDTANRTMVEPVPSTSRGDNGQTGRNKLEQQKGRAQQAAENTVIQAEQYKAAIQKLQGIIFDTGLLGAGEQLNLLPVFNMNSFNEDDEFFHLRCHIDSSLKSKIE